jgi:hypothetical protein
MKREKGYLGNSWAIEHLIKMWKDTWTKGLFLSSAEISLDNLEFLLVILELLLVVLEFLLV